MSLYPLYLKLAGKKCIVLGGGKIAERKIQGLLAAGAEVKVISPEVTGIIEQLSEENKINYIKRPYQAGDLQGYFLVIGATNNRSVNMEIYLEATKGNQLVNCVDEPENCNCYLPAIVNRGDLKIAISTSGKLPYFAKQLMNHLEDYFYDEIGNDLQELVVLRNKLIEISGTDETLKQKLFEEDMKPRVEEIINKLSSK